MQPDVYRDARGYFLETFNAAKYVAAGLPARFVQDNQSSSIRHTIRGLHLQIRKPQGKLVRVVQGEIFDVAVDLRHHSPTFGRFVGEVLSGDNFRQLYVPPGCAHGFCVLSDTAQVEYKCTELYDPCDETGIAFDDPAVSIHWPTETPIVSERDRRHPPFATMLERLSAIGGAAYRGAGDGMRPGATYTETPFAAIRE